MTASLAVQGDTATASVYIDGDNDDVDIKKSDKNEVMINIMRRMMTIIDWAFREVWSYRMMLLYSLLLLFCMFLLLLLLLRIILTVANVMIMMMILKMRKIGRDDNDNEDEEGEEWDGDNQFHDDEG